TIPLTKQRTLVSIPLARQRAASAVLVSVSAFATLRIHCESVFPDVRGFQISFPVQCVPFDSGSLGCAAGALCVGKGGCCFLAPSVGSRAQTGSRKVRSYGEVREHRQAYQQVCSIDR
uniref:Uncharacterized protein n=1 Tax=Anopheles atroparvus TaxID=41427 RepID=A0AAG5CRJ8_ANOAO